MLLDVSHLNTSKSSFGDLRKASYIINVHPNWHLVKSYHHTYYILLLYTTTIILYKN